MNDQASQPGCARLPPCMSEEAMPTVRPSLGPSCAPALIKTRACGVRWHYKHRRQPTCSLTDDVGLKVGKSWGPERTCVYSIDVCPTNPESSGSAEGLLGSVTARAEW